jgi:hypothetical protein
VLSSLQIHTFPHVGIVSSPAREINICQC